MGRILVIYLMVGSVGGLILKTAIPAMTYIAVLLYAVTWPAFVLPKVFGSDWSFLMVLPEWIIAPFFNFEGHPQ